MEAALTVQSSTILDRLHSETLVKYPRLPLQKAPHGRAQPSVSGDWGTSTIYDDSEPPPQVLTAKSSTHVMKRIRSFKSKQNLEIITEVQVEEFEEEDDESDFWNLSFFQACLFATAHEDMMFKMRLLFECNTPLRIMKTMTELPLLQALKYGVEEPLETDDQEDINPHKIHGNEYKLNKLDRDRTDVLNLATSVYIELTSKKSFISLIEFIHFNAVRDHYLVHLLDENAKNSIRKKELAKKLRMQRNANKSVLYEQSTAIEKLLSAIEDASVLMETKGRFVDKWQASRAEQHPRIFAEKENLLIQNTEYYKKRFDHESRVHVEVETLAFIAIQESLQQVEDVMEKYDRDMDAMDLKIQKMNADYLKINDERCALQEKYNLRSQKIKDWVMFKAARTKVKEYETEMHNYALTVQAWWRGLLVRKQLGPYRPKGKGKN